MNHIKRLLRMGLMVALPFPVTASAQTRAGLAQPPEPADTIFINGSILTGAHLRANDPSPTPARVSALAIRGGKVVAAGPDAQILKLRSASTAVVDLHGAFAMPGFNDAHTHMGNAGRQRLAADLTGVRSLAEMKARITAYAAGVAPGAWILGGGWDHTLWPGKMLPNRADLDAVTAGHPAIFRRVDEHMAVANSAALAAAGITAATTDPSGAKIDRGSGGEPTGILREAAATALVFARVPAPTPEQRVRSFTVAMEDALAHGVTSVQDNSDWEDFLSIEQMERTGSLHLRVAEWMDFNQPVAVLEQRRGSHPADDPLLHLTMLKGFMDGSLGSRTAALAAPYADDPGNSGLPRYDQARLNAMATERAAAGFQIGLHAIGDKANAMALDAFAAAEVGRALPSALRLRVEHAQVLLAGDFDRFARLGVIASMQPSHLLTDMNWAADRLGPERVRYAYAWRSFLNRGVVLTFGTDYPVEPINPFRGVYSAVTRRNERGDKTFEPQEKLSLAEAIFAYTQAPAFAEFRESQKGRLEPPFLADLVVLDRDPFTASPEQLLQTTVLRTVVGGQTVYSAPVVAPGR